MNCGHHTWGPGGIGDCFAAMLGDAELWSEDRLRGRRAERDDQVGLHDFYFRLEPRLTRGDFARAGLGMDSAFSARLPFEMLDGVGDVDFGTIDAGLFKSPIEHHSRRADEWLAGLVFLIA